MNISGIDNSYLKNNNISNNIEVINSTVVREGFEKRLQEAIDKRDEKELKKACQEFEGIFLDMMYKQMKATVQKSNLIPSDVGSEIFNSMLDEKYMSEASKNGSFGLAEILYKQFTRSFKVEKKSLNEGE